MAKEGTQLKVLCYVILRHKKTIEIKTIGIDIKGDKRINGTE